MDSDVDADYTTYVRARWDSLVRSAVLLGCSRAEAEDIVQTTLVRCYSGWVKVQSADVPDAYVYRTLVNCLAKSRRRRWWAANLSERQVADALGIPAGTVRSRLSRGLEQLGQHLGEADTDEARRESPC